MKVKVETALFEVPFGSHLYGTNGPTSDLDFKVVCLPSIDDLLLNKHVTNRKVLPEGMKEGQKMEAGEAEYEYIPLQVFLSDFFNGQTYALEIAFAFLHGFFKIRGEHPHEIMDDDTIIEMEDIYLMMETLTEVFLTSSVKKMVGYAVSQSRNYGLKTERYTELGKVLEKFAAYREGLKVGYTAKGEKMPELNKIFLKDHPLFVTELLKLEHVKECEILNGSGGTEMAPAIDICGKQFPLTANFAAVIKSVEGSLHQYGDRVKKYDGEGVDWKALSHAIRITEQVVELSTKGKFTFPRPNAEFLRDVKEGKVSLDVATQYLTDRFNELDDAVANSCLRERTPELEQKFEAYKLDIMSKYYFGWISSDQSRISKMESMIVELHKLVNH